MIRSHVLICGGTGCSSSGSVKLSEKLAEELKAKGSFFSPFFHFVVSDAARKKRLWP